ncbi:MAG: hypothetical protein NT023_10655 [Armatimonadetes bacterium]|nr:hypothetical protein [Armatimonadota bacterium]
MPPASVKPIDDENAAIALLQSWLVSEATDSPEEIRQAEEDLAEFQRNMNADFEIAALARVGGAFDWLADEPDLYDDACGEPIG